jgi:hypothetical protein
MLQQSAPSHLHERTSNQATYFWQCRGKVQPRFCKQVRNTTDQINPEYPPTPSATTPAAALAAKPASCPMKGVTGSSAMSWTGASCPPTNPQEAGCCAKATPSAGGVEGVAFAADAAALPNWRPPSSSFCTSLPLLAAALPTPCSALLRFRRSSATRFMMPARFIHARVEHCNGVCTARYGHPYGGRVIRQTLPAASMQHSQGQKQIACLHQV